MSKNLKTIAMTLVISIALPAFAWAAGSDMSPDGQPLSAERVSNRTITTLPAAGETSSTEVRTPRFEASWEDGSGDRLTVEDHLDRFLVWLRALVI